MNEVTQILSAIEQGDPHAAERLLPLVYAELRTLAAKAVDRITGRYSKDVNDDWKQVESYLQQAYYAVLSA